MVIHSDPVSETLPYQSTVLIETLHLKSGKRTATGVLVSRNILLTAAHVVCAMSADDPLIEMFIDQSEPKSGEGQSDELTELDLSSSFCAAIRLLKDFDSETGFNDLAVVKLNEDFFSPAKLLSDAFAENLKNEHLGTAGWGLRAVGKEMHSATSARQALQLVSKEPDGLDEHRHQFYDPDVASGVSLKDALSQPLFYVSNLNAGDLRIGPCPGDSGAGIFLGSTPQGVADRDSTDPSHILVGIVSHASLKPLVPPVTEDARYARYSSGSLTVACTNLIDNADFIINAIDELKGEKAEFI